MPLLYSPWEACLTPRCFCSNHGTPHGTPLWAPSTQEQTARAMQTCIDNMISRLIMQDRRPDLPDRARQSCLGAMICLDPVRRCTTRIPVSVFFSPFSPHVGHKWSHDRYDMRAWHDHETPLLQITPAEVGLHASNMRALEAELSRLAVLTPAERTRAEVRGLVSSHVSSKRGLEAEQARIAALTSAERQAEEEVRQAHRDELLREQARVRECKRAADEHKQAMCLAPHAILADIFGSVMDDMLCELRTECPDLVENMRAACRSSQVRMELTCTAGRHRRWSDAIGLSKV